MKSTLFLDTTIFFQCIEKERCKTLLNYIIHDGYEFHTSITVLGETLAQIRECDDRRAYLSKFNELLDDYDILIHYPNDPVRILCYILGDEVTDTRMVREPTDRTHLAYSMAYRLDYFITTDKNLIKYSIPKKIEEIGFFKPITLTLEEFRDTILKK